MPAKSHSRAGTPIYLIWRAMRNRCSNPKVKGYQNYGGRGIHVCREWQESFETFFADMGLPPVGMTIEREDNNGPYSKSNCKWASRLTQNRNRRNTVLLECAGRTQTLTEWADETGIAYNTIKQRLWRGATPTIALTPGKVAWGANTRGR